MMKMRHKCVRRETSRKYYQNVNKMLQNRVYIQAARKS